MRCDFNKETGLVRAYAIYKAYQNNPARLKEEMEKAFNNPDIAVETMKNIGLVEGEIFPSTKSYIPPTVTITNTGAIIDVSSNIENIQSYYTGGVGHMRMQSTFRKNLLKCGILDVDSMIYIEDPDLILPNHKFSVLQENILSFKNDLLQKISDKLRVSFTPITSDISYERYTEIVNSILNKFEEYIKFNYSKDLENSSVYDSYVILKNFDRLIDNYAPYIKIDPSYKNKFEGVDKYFFQPTVKHRNHFAKTESSDITKQIGNLAETILGVIPDIEQNGNKLSSTVGVSGFNGAMQSLKRAIMYSNIFGEDSAKFRESLMGGADSLLDSTNPYNLYNIIEIFIARNTRRVNDDKFSEFRQIFLHNKLRGIQQYLFSDNTPQYIKESFVQLFLKTEATEYRAYSYDRDAEIFKGKGLRSKMYSSQKYAFQNVISGGLGSIMASSRVTSRGLLNTYNISVSSSNGMEKITIENNETGETASIDSTDLVNATIETDSPQLVTKFIQDAYSYYIPDTYSTCITNKEGYNWMNDFAPFIALASKEVLRNVGENYGLFTGVGFDSSNIDLSKFNDKLNSIGQRLGVIFGDSIKNTIKSLGGNNLPLYGQTSLEYNWRTCLDNAERIGITPYNAQAYGLFFENGDLISTPQIRSEIELNGIIKNPTALNNNELNRIGILDDFWFQSRNSINTNDSIYLQNATFSDKSRHFLVGYKLNSPINNAHFIESYGEGITLKTVIDDAVIHGTERILEVTRRIRRDKYTATSRRILEDYNKVYPEIGIDIDTINSKYDQEEIAQETYLQLQKLDSWLLEQSTKNGLTLSKVMKKFADTEGVNFEKETYGYSPKASGMGNIRVNETLMKYQKMASYKSSWNNAIKFYKSKFKENIYDLILSGFDRNSGKQIRELLNDDSLSKLGLNHPNFYNEATREYSLVGKDLSLHPIAEAYFALDILLSQEYNSLTIGEIWAHPNKNSDGNIQDGSYYEYSEANRLVNQVKRSVIFGSTIHPFGIGTKNERGEYCGVTKSIDIAIIDDMGGLVFTPNGVSSSIDSQDGSGWCTALQSRLENNSEVDAAVGDNKKTIVHSINPETGTPTLLKWAVYSLTNSVRRNGYGSVANVENLVKRMYSKPLSKPAQLLDLAKVYSDYVSKNECIYIKNNKTLEKKKLVSIINNGDGSFTQVFEDGTTNNPVKGPVKSLYDIDQIFGGAWTYNENGVGTEASVDLLTETAIRYDLRENQIAYAVNSSACKVGATNINPSSSWTNSEKLNTYRISMQFAGVMMNADHELDEAEVTEMSQMISALIEDGHYTNLVTNIYKEIGDIALNNDKIKKVISAVDSGDKEKMAQIVGKSLVESFQSGNKKTIGLAQAFISSVVREIKRTGIETYNLPLDDATIWGAVISDVTSTLTKAGIRRKYEGFAGVLNPSHNMTQYYLTDSGAMMYEQFEQECKNLMAPIDFTINNEISGKNFDGTEIIYNSWTEAARLSPLKLDGTLNPFWKVVETPYDIDFEDTIILFDSNDNKVGELYINNFSDYDKVRHLGFIEGYKIYKNTASPRNLRGVDTLFTVNRRQSEGSDVNIGTYSLYDTDSVRASQYCSELANKKYNYNNDPYFNIKISLIQKVTKTTGLVETFVQNKKPNFNQLKEICNSYTQDFLEKLDFGKEYTLNNRRGEIGPNDNFAFFDYMECFPIKTDGTDYYVLDYQTRPAEIITGRYQMEKLGLDRTDHIHNIKDWTYFYNKLKSKYKNISPSINNLSLSENQEVYDVTLFKDGKPILVKIGEVNPDLRNKLLITPCIEFNKVGDDLRFESETIVSDEKDFTFSDRVRFETIKTGDSNSYTYITVDSQETLDGLANSSFFDDLIIDKDETSESFNQKLKDIAKEQYISFKHGVEFIGARIPTQAMQSFMPFRVIAFSDSEQNIVYVPKANTHIEGSDYDIDKLYLLAISILNNGKLQSGSALQRRVGFDVAVHLFRPTGVEFKEGNGFPIPTKILKDLTSKLNTQDKKDNFIFYLNKINSSSSIYEENGSKVSYIKFEENAPKELKDKLLKLINIHSKTPSFIRDSQDALKTRVFMGIYNITRAAQNQLKAQITVDTCTEELKERAKRTVSGNAEKKITPYNPSSKYVMQVQNMLGKAVVGIGAVSLKTYFILSTSYNRTCGAILNVIRDPRTVINGKNKIDLIRELIESLIILKPSLSGDFKRTTLANINLKPLIRELGKYQEINGESTFPLKELLEEIQLNTSEISAPEFLSGIVSLAADNAKDLALPKLNATEDLVDIYTTAAMIGIPFKEISDIMTSDIFSWITKIGEENIFDETTIGNKVKDKIKVVSLEKLDESDIYAAIFAYNRYVSKTGNDNLKIPNKTKIRDVLNNYDLIWKMVAAFEDPTQGIIKSAIEYESQEAMQERLAMVDENGNVPAAPYVASDYYRIYRLFRDVYLPRAKYLGANLDNSNRLLWLTTILEYVEEMSYLGQQGSINQGLKTNIKGFYDSLYKVENLVNRKVKKLIKEENKIRKKRNESLIDESKIEKFSFKRFLLDPEYRLRQITSKKQVFKCFNILEALSNSPNFLAMSIIQPYADLLLKNTLKTYDFATKVADDIIENKIAFSLSENDFRAITDYISDLHIFSFLSKSDISIDLTEISKNTESGVAIYTNVGTQNSSSLTELKLNTINNIASFKHIMEENVIPYLKNKYKGNKFIDAIARRHNSRLNSITFALPVNIMDVEKDSGLMEQYSGYLSGFNNIAKEKFAGLTVGDWFFLYNLIVNKNSFGQQSLTRIFEDLVDSVNIPKTIKLYYESLSNMDIDPIVNEAIQFIDKFSKGTKTTLPSDYTLYLPITGKLDYSTISNSNLKSIEWKPLTKIEPIDALNGLANIINSINPGMVKVLTDIEELRDLGEDPNVKGFIKNGIVYLNSLPFKDKNTGCASALGIGIHEISHLVIASIKSSDSQTRTSYYKLLRELKKDPEYEEIASLYPDRVGSDLDEEVLCNKIERILTNKINNNSDIELVLLNNGLILNGLNVMFPKITFDEAIQQSLEYAIEAFIPHMFKLGTINKDFIKNSQILATLKTRLYGSSNDNYKLKQDCK